VTATAFCRHILCLSYPASFITVRRPPPIPPP
jgi:hypothetical protein